MITSDSLYLIGKSHQVCQDYTYHGVSETGIPYIIVADGCSTAKDSDIGARILTHCAKMCFNLCGEYVWGDYDRMGNYILFEALKQIALLRLPRAALTSTLITAFKFNGYIYVYTYGDGVTITKDINDNVQVIETAFTNNMPYYLIYWDDVIADGLYTESGSLLKLRETTHGGFKIELSEYPNTYKNVRCFPVDEYKTIIISTDGITSFIDESLPDRPLVSTEQLTPEILGIKTTKGEFLKRRIYRMTKDLEQKGIRHHDDLGMAAFIIEKDSK